MSREALLVMDVQQSIVERNLEAATAMLPTLASAIEAARANGVPVIFVRIAFGRTGPIISERNTSFTRLAATLALGENDEATQFHPAVAPGPHDPIVTKRRVSAFSGSDLEVVLRALDVDALALTGIATSGVVLSTVRHAADLDYRLSVLRDCCVDADPLVHTTLLDRVFPRQAAVVTAAEWIAALDEPAP